MNWDWYIISSKNILNFYLTIYNNRLLFVWKISSYFLFLYLRMSPDIFEHLLLLIASLISKPTTWFGKPISAEQRLFVTLRYVATGKTQQSLSFGYRNRKSYNAQNSCRNITSYIPNFKRPVFKNAKLLKRMSEYFKRFWREMSFSTLFRFLRWYAHPHRVSKNVRNILLQLQGFLQHRSFRYLR